MSTRPGMILQYSHYLAEKLHEEGYEDTDNCTTTNINNKASTTF